MSVFFNRVRSQLSRIPIRLSSSTSNSSYFRMSQDLALGANNYELHFGREVVNRVSFLREDPDFVTNAAKHLSTRFIFYENGNPLVNKKTIGTNLVILTNGDNQLQTVEGKDVAGTAKGLLNCPEWSKILDVWTEDNKNQSPESRDDNKPSFLFLGIKDESVGVDFRALKLYDEETYLDHQGRYFGLPYFAVDVTNSPDVSALIKKHVLANLSDAQEEDIIFSHSWKHAMGLNHDESALFSHGKMYFDWLGRNKFCPGCGSKVIAIHAGGKLRCTNEATEANEDSTKYVCPVRNATVSNVSFPRTDAVVITAITNRERTKTLLSMGKRHIHKKMYSCTAGFMEPSETVEVATKREIWEETGVACSDIQILMTQPWPFPGNLMIGCIATVDFNGENEVINLGHDRELADARWFDISDVRDHLNGNTNNALDAEDIQLPSLVSIAHALIRWLVEKTDTKL
ncbi:hypothetical protein PUMCH_003199 [Australozyma saopauloensis]|uniref:NAD(+) diphosphatase n=1 Tax=Australozyma saopauloensis TaxID=291208 RepID=A0AAX4HBP3_9ASCO|nr:hypothetical protein PUMCH_003199 [[Candida] saopauloensis]